MAEKPGPKGPSKFDDAAQQVALDHCAETGETVGSADAADVSLRTLNRHIADDREFAARWAAARDRFLESLEQCATKRAKDKSDPLMQTLLKANGPNKYRERASIDHQHKGKVDVGFDPGTMSEANQEKLLEIIESERERREVTE